MISQPRTNITAKITVLFWGDPTENLSKLAYKCDVKIIVVDHTNDNIILSKPPLIEATFRAV